MLIVGPIFRRPGAGIVLSDQVAWSGSARVVFLALSPSCLPALIRGSLHLHPNIQIRVLGC